MHNIVTVTDIIDITDIMGTAGMDGDGLPLL
jgi:hypothetical protein